MRVAAGGGALGAMRQGGFWEQGLDWGTCPTRDWAQRLRTGDTKGRQR